jgi:AcrR family transcriptional regulator
MTKEGEDRRVRKSKTALKKGFAQLLSQKDIKDISVKELTDLADVNRGTFYLHFKDIYDLQEQLENEIIEEITTAFDNFKPSSYGGGSFAILLVLFEYFYDNAEICRTVTCANINQTFLKKLRLILHKQCMTLWVDEFGLDCSEKELEYLATYVLSGYTAGLAKWTAEGMKEPPEEIAGLLSRIVLNGTNFLKSKT